MIDLTLILLAKDRPKFLERWIDYTIAKKPKCKIIISDGGKKKINKKNLLKLSKNKINFKYIKFGYDKDYRQFCKKIYTSVKICSTKYVVLCADDDFFVYRSFLKGIDYLNKNKKYVCYGAKMITFGASNKFDQINSLPSNLSQMYKNNKINYKSKSAQSRFFFFLKNSYFVVFHCLFKRDVLLNVYSKILRSNLTIPNIVDLYANSLIYCIGLVKTGSEIMRLKQYHPTSDAKSRDINNTLSDKKFKRENIECISKLTNFIQSKENINKFSLKKKISKKIQYYYDMSSLAYFQKNEKLKKISFYVYIKNFILNKYTNDFYYFFKKKFVIYKLKVFVKQIKDKKIKKEINFIFNFFTERLINQKKF